jgi:transposase
MQLKTILNRVEHYKSFVYGKVALLEDGDRLSLEVCVQPRKGSRPICSGCHCPGPGYDRLRPRKFEFVPLWQIAVFFVYALRRVDCPRCGVTVEEVPWAEGKNHLTRSYQWFLAGWAKRLSWSGVAEAFHTTWDHVRNGVDHAVRWGLVHRDLKGIEAIGVDEVQWKRGQQYLTLVYQIDARTKRLLWIGKERTEASFREFFHLLGDEVGQGLRYVCSDMWGPYLKVIAEKAKDAVHILDRFHIMAKMNKAIDEVRAAEAKQLKADGYEPVLKNSRWCLLKRPENRTKKQTVKLRELLRYNLRSVRAHLQREDFQRFWEYSSPTWAGKFLDEWTTRVMRSKIEPMKKVARMLRRHRELILNWFEAQGKFSSCVVEGLNNKVKLTTRKSYGFRTEEAVKLALYHNLGALPEPNFTHRFF